MSAQILVIRGGALGDFVLGLPALRALQMTYPGAHLELIAPSEVLPLVASLVDVATPIERAENAAFFADSDPPTELSDRYRDLDLVIIWMADPDGVVRRTFQGNGARQVLQSPALPPREGGIHATDHLLATLASLENVTGTPTHHFLAAVPTILPSPEALERAFGVINRLGLSPSDRLLAIHPGSGGRWKCWPPERFAWVAQHMASSGLKPILTQGPADEEVVSEVQSAFPGAALPVISGLRVDELAALLSLCTLYLGNDSGVTHLAAATGVPTVALFGPTDPTVWRPRGPWVSIIRGDGGRLEAIAVDRAVEALLHHDVVK